MTLAQRRNRLTTHFSERIPDVKRRISVLTGLKKPYNPTSSEMSNILEVPRLRFTSRHRAWKHKVDRLIAPPRKNNNEFLLGSD
jgi:hypothetical protein